MSVTTNEKKFVMKHIFKSVMNMENGDTVDGPIEYHYNAQWKIRLVRDYGRFLINLDCMMTSELFSDPFFKSNWFIESIITGKMFNKNGHPLQYTIQKSFRPEEASHHHLTALPNENPSYIVNENITVEFTIQIYDMLGILEKQPSIDFGRSQFSDVVLMVGDQKFHVNKMYLSYHCTYFNTLFSGESKKSEIELKDIDTEYFQNFLELIYGDSLIDDTTVDGILKLADFFDSKIAMKRCERFLMEKSQKSLKIKYNLAIKYNLDKLKEKCMSELKTSADFLSILPANSADFDHTVWKELLVKAVTSRNLNN